MMLYEAKDKVLKEITNKRTECVTMSLHELLIADKNQGNRKSNDIRNME